MKKKILLIVLILSYGCFNNIFAATEIIQGHVEKVKKDKIQSELFIDKANKLDKKDIIKMTVSQVLDAELSKVNDEFFAEVIDNVEGKDGVIIPRGTIAHGRIKKANKAKSFGRNGELILTFDTLITPDGREIPIQGQMTTRLHLLTETSDIIKTNAVYATAGAAAGSLLALNWFGLGGAVMSNGSSIAGGAAIGSSVGLGIAFFHKGKDVLISPGDEIIVKLNSISILPVYQKNVIQYQEIQHNGLDVKIIDINYKKDVFDNVDTIKILLSVSNLTDKNFSIFDIALVDDFNTVYYPNVFENEELKNMKINRGDKINCAITFSVDNVKSRLWLGFYDNQTKEIIAKFSLDNAYSNISSKSKEQNKTIIQKKKNFYMEANPFDSE